MQLDIASKADFIRLEKTVDKILSILGAEIMPSLGEWMKSAEVKRILKCSDSSLTNYRRSNSIIWKKVGGTFYYQIQKKS